MQPPQGNGPPPSQGYRSQGYGPAYPQPPKKGRAAVGIALLVLGVVVGICLLVGGLLFLKSVAEEGRRIREETEEAGASAKELGSVNGKLTKEGAKKLIERQQHGVVFKDLKIGTLARCQLKQSISTKGARLETMGMASLDQRLGQTCVNALTSIGMIEDYKCDGKEDFATCTFLPGSVAPKMWIAYGVDLVFDCGTQEVGDVLAVFTQENQARVQFVVERTLNADLLMNLSACDIQRPKERETVETKAFRRDDDGNWSIDPADTLGF